MRHAEASRYAPIALIPQAATLFSAQAELALWEEGIVRSAKALNQWELLSDYAKTWPHTQPELLMECAWKSAAFCDFTLYFNVSRCICLTSRQICRCASLSTMISVHQNWSRSGWHPHLTHRSADWDRLRELFGKKHTLPSQPGRIKMLETYAAIHDGKLTDAEARRVIKQLLIRWPASST